MVFFTCNACGQSLKKSHVEKHCTSQCRNCEMLSCIDCGKDFWGEEYKTHTKCISEAEKYSGKDYKAKPNKGEEKQESWMQLIQTTIDTATDLKPDLLNFLKQLVTYDNVPRKQSKFENYVRNSMRIKNENLISRAWEVFNSAHKAASEKKTETDSPAPSKDDAQPPSAENEENKKKKKKTKPGDDDQSSQKEQAITATNPEEVANDDDSSTQKKHKKRKHSGLEDEPAAAEVVPEDANGKRKKRKKGKRGDDEAVESKEDVSEKGDDENKETIPLERDQKKSKKRKSENITADEIVSNVVDEDCNKESKKHKKRKDSNNAIDEQQIVNGDTEQVVVGEESTNNKRKKDKKRNKEENSDKAEPSPADQLMPDSIGEQEELSKSMSKKHKKSKKNKGEVEESKNVGEKLTPQEESFADETEGSSKKTKKSKRKSVIAAEGDHDENESPTKMTNGGLPKNENGNIEVNGSTPSLQKPSKFKWAKIAEGVLLQTPDKTLSVKKLKKKVFAEYVSQTSDVNGENAQELEEKFADKVTKNDRFQIEGKQIKLVA